MFIVDFFCPEARLIVEVDGVTHVDRGADAERDAWLQSRGYAVLRLCNNEVLGNLDGVLRVIADAATPPPNPLPQGEGETGWGEGAAP
jgi:very-short-patch-repair endonuclease